jgi:Domain of unknown function (DUF4134)
MKNFRLQNNRWAVALVVAALVLAAPSVWAQAGGNGAAGIEEATSQIRGYFDPSTRLMYAVGAVLGLIGGIRVYSKWNSGDPDTQKVAAGWFGSCVFLVLVATILRAFFL